MTDISLIVNGSRVTGSVEPRTHLADFLREHLHFTGTHLRCEQGVCGACTILIDGALARSCLTYAVSCQEAEVTTIEGLEYDPIMEKLRDAFSREHGLQCGFCTPGMLITARDIVTRLPHADDKRVRVELSGNLCRCTGYAGIVRAVCRVLDECRTQEVTAPPGRIRLGPVGVRQLVRQEKPVEIAAPIVEAPARPPQDFVDLGLGMRPPNLETQITFTVRRPAGEVWAAFQDLERVARCMPGASLTSPPSNGHV
ncbi:MAG: 2Fe-2S iron-sulfur cluster-binding protein, partial [Rhodomicrobium sp.]